MKLLVYLPLMTLLVNVSSFEGSDDRIIKKYGMMKIYESCFGKDVLKQIRKEMKQACAKCASLEIPPAVPTTTLPPPEEKPQDAAVEPNSVYHNQPSFDVEKLHQAFLAFRPNHLPQTSLRPFSGAGFYNPSYANPGFAVPAPMFYPGFQQTPFSPYGVPYLGQGYFGNRMSRDMDSKNHFEAIMSKLSGKIRNVTCVMQELGYLDENLEPNYVKISERIGNLPVHTKLRSDMQDGVDFCRQFSQCMPEVKKDKVPLFSHELVRPAFFFKCYKQKKLEACIMKDVREKLEYAGVLDEELEYAEEIKRTGKASKLPKDDSEKEVDAMTESMYEFLYASDSGVDIDGVL